MRHSPWNWSRKPASAGVDWSANNRAIGNNPPSDVAENRAAPAGTSDVLEFVCHIRFQPQATFTQNYKMKISRYEID
jgi:hypothetical protein